jgi:hypothetical protein
MDIAEVRHGEGKLYLFVPLIDSKFAVARLYDEATRPDRLPVPARAARVVPYRIHTLLTDNGIQFAEQPRTGTPSSRAKPLRHDLRGQRIEHR